MGVGTSSCAVMKLGAYRLLQCTSDHEEPSRDSKRSHRIGGLHQVTRGKGSHHIRHIKVWLWVPLMFLTLLSSGFSSAPALGVASCSPQPSNLCYVLSYFTKTVFVLLLVNVPGFLLWCNIFLDAPPPFSSHRIRGPL